MDRNELSLEPCHLGVPLIASKMISKSMLHLAQSVHLSCSDTNTVSEQTETRFHMSHVTYEFHQVRPIRFLSLWYVLVQTVHLSCTNTNTNSKQIETRFDMPHIT
jgi:hypothetical protein